jgi:plasmid stability protein
MASITIRGLEETVKKKLKARAAKHGHSMEEEAREILRCGVARQEKLNLAEAIRSRFEPLGGVELPEFPRGEGPRREPPNFE